MESDQEAARLESALPSDAEGHAMTARHREALSVAFNRAILRTAVGDEVSTLEVKIACATVLSSYLGQITDDAERAESFEEFVDHLRSGLNLPPVPRGKQ